MNKFLIIPALLSFTLPPAGISAVRHSWTVLRSDRQGLTLEIIPSYTDTLRVWIGGVEYQRPDFAGAMADERLAPGDPDLRSLMIPIRLPNGSTPDVEVVAADMENVSGVRFAPVARWKSGDVSPSAEYAVNERSYSRGEFLPSRAAEMGEVGSTRGAYVGALRIFPMQYNPSSRTLKVVRRMVVSVTFRGEPGPMAGDELLRRSVANPSGAIFPSPRRVASVSSVLRNGTWFRFPVGQTGVYVLDGQTLLGAGVPPSVDPRTIRIFNNGGYEVSPSVLAPVTDDLRENAVYVVDGGTAGTLDAADAIYFYGRGTRGWKYAPGTKQFSHYLDHYTETNTYWLAYGIGPSKAMTQVEAYPGPAPYRPQTVVGKIFREDEKVNILNSGLEWLGQLFTPGDQITYTQALPGLDASQPVTYNFRVGARSNGFSSFTIDEHGTRLATVGLSPTVVGDYNYTQFVNRVVTPQQVPAFTDGRTSLRFGFSTSAVDGNGYIDWYEILYPQFLTAAANQFTFHAKDTSAMAEFDVTGFSGTPLVFDVSAYDSVVLYANPRFSGDTCSFVAQLSAGSASEFALAGPGAVLRASGLTRAANQDLHGDTTRAPYIIITHPDFAASAQRLKAYREQPGPGYLKTMVVDVNQIYNEFSCGTPSPVAIRNYLRYLSGQWGAPPSYVLLFGDGDYDYKRITTAGKNWIPPWETPESFLPLYSYECEDDFVTFTQFRRIEIGLGRLAARSAAEASTMVDKIIEYETHPVNDPWRMRVTLVADDGLAGVNADGSIQNDLFLHTQQAEWLSALVPGLFEQKKIYLYEYPTVITPAGRKKPAVTTAIENQINQGTLVLNFTGHGNPRVWTHEQVFVNETDFPALANKGKYFFLVAATCNYSNVDMVGEQSGGEILMTLPGAGAIAVLSATRPVFAGDNSALNQSVYDYLFLRDAAGDIIDQRVGDVLFETKQVHYGPGSSADNDRKFFLLGDPALRIAFPSKFASIDSLNHASTQSVFHMQALGRVTVTATVHDSSAAGPAPFDGQAQLVVFDSNRKLSILDSVETSPNAWQRRQFSFTTSGNTLFRGDQSVKNGTMSASFIVPKDISYANDYGRMTLYVWNASTDGGGYNTNFIVGGTDSTAARDVRGPEIRLYIDSRGFRPGDIVSGTPVLLADLTDSSGINTSGGGVGHRLEAWLDDASTSVDLTDYYKSAPDTYQQGTVTYPFGALPQGSHKLKLRAWDTYNNSNVSETTFDVMTGAGLQLSSVYNFPNPFRSSTVFTFRHNQLTPIDAEVKIYTVAGRLVQSIRKDNITDAFVQLPWDGRDRDGDAIANGVYLYKVIAKTADSRFSSEAVGKLSISK